MNPLPIRTIRALGVLALISYSISIATAQTPTSRIVNAANTFLSTLNDQQRQSVLFAFDDAKQRANWSNFPVSFVPRAGVSLKGPEPRPAHCRHGSSCVRTQQARF
jgi:Protein of unknown function (DUF3500)